MRRIRAVFLRLGSLLQKSRRERELENELTSHLELHIDDNLRAGMTPGEARRQAILKLGGVEPTKENCRDRRGLPFLDMLFQDLRYGARTLAYNRGFAAVTVATLALGIGTSTAMFTVVQAILLRSLPYPQPERLLDISESNPLRPSTHNDVSLPDFLDWQRTTTAFSGMALYAGINDSGQSNYDLFLTGAGEPVRLKGLGVTTNLFDVLGVAPMMGRSFTSEEFYDGADRVAILSYGFWQTRFAADPQIVGRSISLNGMTRKVIGVMPRGFFFPSKEIQVFVPPMGFAPGDRYIKDRRLRFWRAIGRLRPGVSLEQARGQMAGIASRLEQMYPDTNGKMGVRLENLHATFAVSSRPALLMLLSAVAVLFLIVCSNVANLQLGRSAARVREFAIRQALGAGRGRLARQLLIESLILSVFGGLLGFGIAVAARAALLRFAPTAIPLYADLRIDNWVILFNIAITIAAPLLFGIGPALSAARPASLRDRGESASRSNRLARDFLVAVEIAFSVVLVVGAGLLIRSYVRLESVDLGFRTEHAVSFRVKVPDEPFLSRDEQVRKFSNIENRLRVLPGIEAVGASAKPLLRDTGGGSEATVEGRAGYERDLRINIITSGYFRAMGIPLLRGRFFNEFDTKSTAMVNVSLEKAYFHGENAVGRRIRLGLPTDVGSPWISVVGVVADQKQAALDRPVQPEIYLVASQYAPNSLTFVLRGPGDPGAVATAARRAVQSVDKDLTITDVATLGEVVQASIGDQRFRTSLLSAFAGIALLLAALGVYGVLAYSVAQRSTEIGIRMALGAPVPRLFGMVLGDGMRPVLAGSVLGFAGAYAVTRLIKSLLFGIEPADAPTYLLTTAILVTVALSACAIPASKAIRADPLVSLLQQ